MLAALDTLRRKGSQSRRILSRWTQLDENALAVECIAAAVAGRCK